MYENTSDYLILDEHVCDEHALEWPGMSEKDLYVGMDGLVVYGWVALYDMHDNEWECMRVTEVVWESLIFDGGEGHPMLIYIIRHAW